jgi:membrane associated rhomboid family serine protease
VAVEGVQESETSPAETPTALLATASERQAMDWGLVLASQGIEATIEQIPGPGRGWGLRVAAADADRATQVVRLYRRENRRFAWRRELPGGTAIFHNGVLAWVVVLVAVYLLQPFLLQSGAFDTGAVRHGAWWRAFTATWLHADVAHLAANTLAGGLTVGLAMGRFGPGTALFLTLLGGAAGNLFAMVARGGDYRGLGASGVVMAALGLLAGHAVTWWRVSRHATRPVISSIGAGIFLFLVVGVDPRADVLAHLGGFVSGLVLGAAASWLSWTRHDRWLGGAYAVLAAGTWILAVLRGN